MTETQKQEFMKQVSAFIDNAINESASKSSKKATISDVDNNIKLLESIEKILDVEQASTTGVVEYCNRFRDYMMNENAPREEQVYETFLRGLEDFKVLNVVESVIEDMKQRVKENLHNIKIVETFEVIKGISSDYLNENVEDACVNFIKDKSLNNRKKLLESLAVYKGDPYVENLKAVAIDFNPSIYEPSSNSLDTNRSLIRKAVYSMVHAVDADTVILGYRGRCFVKSVTTFREATHEEMIKLPQEFLSGLAILDRDENLISLDFVTNKLVYNAYQIGLEGLVVIDESGTKLISSNGEEVPFPQDSFALNVKNVCEYLYHNVSPIDFATEYEVLNAVNSPIPFNRVLVVQLFGKYYLLFENIFTKVWKLDSSLSYSTAIQNINENLGVAVETLHESDVEDGTREKNRSLLKTKQAYESKIENLKTKLEKIKQLQEGDEDNQDYSNLHSKIKGELDSTIEEYKEFQDEYGKVSTDIDFTDSPTYGEAKIVGDINPDIVAEPINDKEPASLETEHPTDDEPESEEVKYSKEHGFGFLGIEPFEDETDTNLEDNPFNPSGSSVNGSTKVESITKHTDTSGVCVVKMPDQSGNMTDWYFNFSLSNSQNPTKEDVSVFLTSMDNSSSLPIPSSMADPVINALLASEEFKTQMGISNGDGNTDTDDVPSFKVSNETPFTPKGFESDINFDEPFDIEPSIFESIQIVLKDKNGKEILVNKKLNEAELIDDEYKQEDDDTDFTPEYDWSSIDTFVDVIKENYDIDDESESGWDISEPMEEVSMSSGSTTFDILFFDYFGDDRELQNSLLIILPKNGESEGKVFITKDEITDGDETIQVFKTLKHDEKMTFDKFEELYKENDGVQIIELDEERIVPKTIVNAINLIISDGDTIEYEDGNDSKDGILTDDPSKSIISKEGGEDIYENDQTLETNFKEFSLNESDTKLEKKIKSIVMVNEGNDLGKIGEILSFDKSGKTSVVFKNGEVKEYPKKSLKVVKKRSDVFNFDFNMSECEKSIINDTLLECDVYEYLDGTPFKANDYPKYVKYGDYTSSQYDGIISVADDYEGSNRIGAYKKDIQLINNPTEIINMMTFIPAIELNGEEIAQAPISVNAYEYSSKGDEEVITVIRFDNEGLNPTKTTLLKKNIRTLTL